MISTKSEIKRMQKQISILYKVEQILGIISLFLSGYLIFSLRPGGFITSERLFTGIGTLFVISVATLFCRYYPVSLSRKIKELKGEEEGVK